MLGSQRQRSRSKVGGTVAIGDAFQWCPDKSQAFKMIQDLSYDKCGEVRRAAVIAMRTAFPYLIDKKQEKQVLSGLGRLLGDDEINVRKWAREALDVISEVNKIPYLSEVDFILIDLFKSRYQKERKNDRTDVNSKTLKLLKKKILGLANDNMSEIKWLDIGCGNGRCLDVLEALKDLPEHEDREKQIYYIGIDPSNDNIKDAISVAEKYAITKEFLEINAMDIDFNSEFDIISLILVLHEIDPLQLPYILKKSLNALKEDGLILISDFNEPYEDEENVVIWNPRDLMYILDNVGGVIINQELIPTERNSNEFALYRCCVRKGHIDSQISNKFLANYDKFLNSKIDDITEQYHKIGKKLEDRVKDILSRSDVDIKNITSDEIKKIEKEFTKEDVLIFRKRRSLLEQILFLREKLNQHNESIDPLKLKYQLQSLLNSGRINGAEYEAVGKILSKALKYNFNEE